MKKIIQVSGISRFKAAVIISNIAYGINCKKGLGFTRREVMKEVFSCLSDFENDYLKVVVFTNAKGQICTRVVCSWSNHHTVKGTGRPCPNTLYTDVAKYCLGINDTISVVEGRVEKECTWGQLPERSRKEEKELVTI